ncbi:MAG: TlpA disulfide reductase family protein [Candidatus Hydrogenedentota bacterium]
MSFLKLFLAFIAGAIATIALGVAVLLVASYVMRNGDPALQFKPPVFPSADADFSWTLLDLAGQQVPFESFRGKTIFLTVWKPSCVVCKHEMPLVQNLYDKVAGDNIVFATVAVDNEPDKIIDLAQEEGYTLPMYTYEGDRPSMYETGNVPSTFIISPAGKLVMRFKGPAAWNDDSCVQYLRGLAVGGETPDVEQAQS